VAGVTRSLAILVALGTAGLVAAVALAAPNPGSPKVVIDPAQQARAKTILLKQAELPGTGWMRKSTDFTAANPACAVKHYSLSKLTANAQIGAQFTRAVDTGTFLVESDVHVFVTPAQSKVAADRLSDLGYGRCLGATLVSEAPPGSKATSRVKAFAVKGLVLPTDGFRITVKVVTGGKTSTLSAVVLGFRRGRTVTSLSVLGLDKGWSSAKLRSVAAKLASRTAAV
jgi:hypothetical protein